MKSFECPACGTGTVELRLTEPTRTPYRNLKEMEIPAVELPICSDCKELWLDKEATERYHAVLEEAYASALSQKAEQALTILRSEFRLRDLERALGVSAGYFSKIKSGKSTSPPLASLLLLLAADPRRVEELSSLLNDTQAPFQQKPKTGAFYDINLTISSMSQHLSTTKIPKVSDGQPERLEEPGPPVVLVA